MVDHSRVPTDDDWARLCDELEDHVAFLRTHGPTVRARAKGATSPYPARSPGANAVSGGSIGGMGGSSDPTADQVVRLAGGDDDKADTWQGTRDPVALDARAMVRAATDARNQLRGATAAARRALPVKVADAPREVCVTCGTPKHIAKGWVQSEGRCGACSRRLSRSKTQAMAQAVVEVESARRIHA